MRIGLDVDEVVRDWVGTLKRQYRQDHPSHEIMPIEDWALAPYFPLGEGIWPYIETRTKEIFEDAPILPGARMMIDALKDAGHEVWLITSQRKPFVIATAKWIHGQGLPVDGVAFTFNKASIPCHVYLDDGQHNLESIAKARHGAVCVAFDKPWNQGWGGFRVSTHDQFVRIVDGLNGGLDYVVV